ncbi:ABC transporter permease subunit [Aphanothece sacrum]|uniref:ABC transporter substrate-binding protein n=2 Tax=Aphanothece sacrum TaxID=1122 RepID=A0A401IEC7_APHSA|nr:ABC transporter permease subunit [Aphanothece sacrum]GBF79594.1 ABC transporter substrate-binding protein [Aphanothece sacrum FPU1]GBF87053.1 ABC transporter substrate-binding protein [Aphanothece sacrum FPU3]
MILLKQSNQVWLGFISCLLIIILIFYSQLTGANANTLVIATEPTFPPFEMAAKTGGELEGFDIDLMRAIGQESGLKVKFESLPFDGIIPALQSGTVDGAISGMTITPERAKTIAFSRPYFKAGLAIAVQENNSNIKSFADLDNQRIAVQISTTGANKVKTIPGAKITTFDNAPLALQELVNGNVDAVVNDAPVTLYAIKTGNLQGIKVVSELLTEEYYGIALPHKSPYIQIINNSLQTLIDQGKYQVIYQKWFAGSPSSLPLIAPSLQENEESSINFNQLILNLIKGAIITLELTAFSVFLGMVGGALLALARLSNYEVLRWLARFYIDGFRGTPLLVQIFMIYFGLPALFQQLGFTFNIARFPAAVMALSLNASAYLAEIIRGGIQSVPKGQGEAAKSLGMTPTQTMRYVIFPQAFRYILPPLGNEFITILKDTSLVAVIGFEELFRQGQLMVATTYRAFEIYTAVAIIYLILTLLSSRLFSWLEWRLNPLQQVKN